MSDKKTLHERLGGYDGIMAVVISHDELMRADPRIKDFFKHHEKERLRKGNATFFQLITGGPNHYEGENMKETHKTYKIGEMEFVAVWETLVEAMKKHNVPAAEMAEVKALFDSYKKDVITI